MSEGPGRPDGGPAAEAAEEAGLAVAGAAPAAPPDLNPLSEEVNTLSPPGEASGSVPRQASRPAGTDRQARVWRLYDGQGCLGNAPGQARRAASAPPPRRRRGWLGQRHARQAEQQARLAGVRFGQRVLAQGGSRALAAALLGLKERTLRSWQQAWRRDALQARARGRPAARSSVARRNEVIGFLAEVGAGVALASLRQQFPQMARAELADLLRRYRRVWRKQHRRLLAVLHWLRPGSVWAVDFVQAPVPIEGHYPYVLAVRDLASHYVLLWLPVTGQSAQVVTDALQALFAQHGCALVLKSDNGPGFRAVQTTEVLNEERVQTLFSPAYCPNYNGGIEASNGSLKTRTHHQAALAGHPQVWTCADLEAARQEANRQARPWGENGPSPEQVWQQRTPISAEERERFAALLKEKLEEVCREQQKAKERDPGNRTDQAKAQREAISRTLVALGYLSYTRRRIPAPI